MTTLLANKFRSDPKAISDVIDDLERGEKPLSFAEASRTPPMNVHLAQIHRYAGPGIRNARLGWAYVGGRKVTTKSEIIRFLRRLNGATGQTESKPATAARAVDHELDAAGL